MTDEIKWFQSKGIWAGIVTAILGLYATLAGQLHLPVIPDWVFAVLGAMGIYARAVATKEIAAKLT